MLKSLTPHSPSSEVQDFSTGHFLGGHSHPHLSPSPLCQRQCLLCLSLPLGVYRDLVNPALHLLEFPTGHARVGNVGGRLEVRRELLCPQPLKVLLLFPGPAAPRGTRRVESSLVCRPSSPPSLISHLSPTILHLTAALKDARFL